MLVKCITKVDTALHRNITRLPLGVNEGPVDELHLLGVAGGRPLDLVLPVGAIHVSVAGQGTRLEQTGLAVLRTMVGQRFEQRSRGFLGRTVGRSPGLARPGLASVVALVVLVLLVEASLDVVADLHHEPPGPAHVPQQGTDQETTMGEATLTIFPHYLHLTSLLFEVVAVLSEQKDSIYIVHIVTLKLTMTSA